MDLRGKRALVTGASSGIGVSFAKQLAKSGASIVLTARRKERLEALAEQIRKEHGVTVEVVACDLGKPDGAKRLWDQTEGKGTQIDVLINNAGFGTKQPFIEQSWDKTFEELQLNLVSLTELTKRFSQVMVKRESGHILNVASVGAYLPTPTMASYGAGKAYVRNFSEGLAYELSGSGVRVCCLCPGATESEFADTAGLKLASWKKLAYMSADRCASIGLSALFRGRRNIVSGFWNSVGMFSLRFVPRPIAAWLAATFLCSPLASTRVGRDARAAMSDTKKDTKAGGFKMPAWGWVLVVGLVLAVTLHFVHVEGALGAVLEMIGGLLLIGGSCEALIIAVEGGSAILGLSKFVGGTFAAVVSNIPEIALLGFFVVDDPTMAFIIGMMSIYTNSMTFALYAVLLPKDRGAAKIPAPIVKAGTDLLSFGGGLCLALAGAMIVLREFDSPITTLGAPELAFVGGALFLVFVTFLVTLVKTSREDAAQGHPSEGRARDSQPPQPVEAVNVDAAKADAAHDDHEGVPKTMAGVLGLLAIGVVGSFLGGHAMSDVGDFIVETFPGLSNMVVALILAIISGVPTYVIVGNAHLKKQSLIALSNTFGGLTQNLFNTMAICCLMIAGFNWIGILDHTTIPINAATTLSVLFIYPTYSILSRAIEDDGKFNWIEIVSLLALFSFLVFLLTREL